MIRPITYFGDPILRKPASQVTDFGKWLELLVKDMAQTMFDLNGIGIAAPQVGESVAVCVIRTDMLGGSKGVLDFLVNPVIKEFLGTQINGEGCLSLPGIWGSTIRPQRIVVEAQDLQGRASVQTFDGPLAQVVSHEVDHLNGRLLLDRMKSITREAALRKIKRLSRPNAPSRIKLAQRPNSMT